MILFECKPKVHTAINFHVSVYMLKMESEGVSCGTEIEYLEGQNVKDICILSIISTAVSS